MNNDFGLEHKFSHIDNATSVDNSMQIEGYASLFGEPDQGRDVVAKGAYAKSLAKLAHAGRTVKMLWQHDPAQPIGVWQEVREDDKGLFVKGRLLQGVPRAQEAANLLRAGAIDGLSIGYRTIKSHKDATGQRVLDELELWEVSLVTFPMLPDARVGAKSHEPISEIARAFETARSMLADISAAPTPSKEHI